MCTAPQLYCPIVYPPQDLYELDDEEERMRLRRLCDAVGAGSVDAGRGPVCWVWAAGLGRWG